MSRRKGKLCGTAEFFLPDILEFKEFGRLKGDKKGMWGKQREEDRRGGEEKKEGSGVLLRPNEEMIHWIAELICAVSLSFTVCCSGCGGFCPHHSLDPTSSSTCLGPAQLGFPQPFMAFFPLNCEADMHRTIINAWLQNFTEQLPISSSLIFYCPDNLVLASGMMCYSPPSTPPTHTHTHRIGSILVWHKSSPSFIDVYS